MSKVEAAVAWGRRGFRVFPCLPDEPGRDGNDKRAKKPVWEGWTEWASADEASIRAWWGATPYNIGVLTDNLVVVDIDMKAGRDGLASWMNVHGGFDTLMVKTPSGGLHLYYMGANVAINQGALGPGLDIRSHHGYVMAPGSTVDGVPYTVSQDGELALVPPAVVLKCKPPGEKHVSSQTSLVEQDDSRAIQLATDAINRAEPAVSGELSEAAYKLACRVRDYGISEEMACNLMALWGLRCSPPVTGDDLRARISNAYAYAQNPIGQKHPDVLFGVLDLPEVPPLLAAPAVIAPSLGIAFGNAASLADMEPRPWVLNGLLLRNEITTLIAPGGVGKSLFQIATALCLAAGIDMMDFKNNLHVPSKSIIYNAEDSLDEMTMRAFALCSTMRIDPAVALPRIAFISGKTHGRVRLVSGGHQPAINQRDFDALVALGADPEVSMIGLDPLNKVHDVNGIDNIAMTFVMEQIERLAEQTNTAVLVSHHTSKPSGPNVIMPGNVDSSQGAASVANSSRIVMTMAPPTDADISQYGMMGDDRELYVRVDSAKANRTLKSSAPLWLHKVPVTLVLKDMRTEVVGGFEKADMHSRSESARFMVLDGVARAMAKLNVATVPIKEAVKGLKVEEPILGKMRDDDLRQRILSYLVQPCVLKNGFTMRVEDGQVIYT